MINVLGDLDPILSVDTVVKLDPVDESITEWLRKQGYTGEFDRRYNALILPLHMKGLFTYEAPYLRFSDHVPIDQMFIADMREML